MSDETITLISKEGESFTVLQQIAEQSKTLSDLIKEADSGAPIPLPTIPSKTLCKIVEFCMKHKDDGPEPPKAPEDEIDDPNHVLDKPYEMTDWDKTFTANMDQDETFELILAANYLDVRKLLKVMCRVIALSVLGKSPKDIYAMFGVQEELTPEEEVIKENPWLADK